VTLTYHWVRHGDGWATVIVDSSDMPLFRKLADLCFSGERLRRLERIFPQIERSAAGVAEVSQQNLEWLRGLL